MTIGWIKIIQELPVVIPFLIIGAHGVTIHYLAPLDRHFSLEITPFYIVGMFLSVTFSISAACTLSDWIKMYHSNDSDSPMSFERQQKRTIPKNPLVVGWFVLLEYQGKKSVIQRVLKFDWKPLMFSMLRRYSPGGDRNWKKFRIVNHGELFAEDLE